MKSILTALLALTFTSGLAHAAHEEYPEVPNSIDLPNLVEIPAAVNESSSLLESIEALYAVQLTELSALEIQQKYYQIMRASFEGSHALSVAFDNEAARAGVRVTAGTVQLVMDAYLARMWLRGATPSYIALKDVYFAYRGQQAKLSVQGLSTLSALKVLRSKALVPKNVIATAALGAFAYVQHETFWVLQMSEEQFRETLRLLDVKIASIQAKQAAIADTRGPLPVK